MAEEIKETKRSNKYTTPLGIIIGLVILYLIFNWGTVYRAFAPPNPVIVSKGVENTTFLEFNPGVWAEVRNDGGNGTIAMEATFSQGDHTYTKTTTRYFKSLETGKMEIVFNEARLLGGQPSYSLNVYSFGK